MLACRPAKRVQSEAELREAQWAQEEHQGCCAAACPPTVLIPALILFSDLIGSLASGNTIGCSPVSIATCCPLESSLQGVLIVWKCVSLNLMLRSMKCMQWKEV